jgi:hypothetical protein
MADITTQRGGTDWHALLPKNIAERQSAWELDQRILIAWQAGATLSVIAQSLRVSKQAISQRKVRAERRPTSPLDDYLAAHHAELLRIAFAVATKARGYKPRNRGRKPPARPFGRRHVIVEGNRLVLGELVASGERLERPASIG